MKKLLALAIVLLIVACAIPAQAEFEFQNYSKYSAAAGSSQTDTNLGSVRIYGFSFLGVGDTGSAGLFDCTSNATMIASNCIGEVGEATGTESVTVWFPAPYLIVDDLFVFVNKGTLTVYYK